MILKLRHMPPGLVAVLISAAPLACETGSATFAVIDNAYPAPATDGGTGPQNVVYRAWWSVTYFATPVPAGTESDTNRVIPTSDYAYALLAPNWDPASSGAPTTLIAMRTKNKLAVARGDTLHITLSDETALGNCAAGQPLTQDQANLVTQSIFPAEFAGFTYDAATCTMSTSTDAASGTDAAGDAAAEANADANDAAGD